jgi:hypothetical protein
MMLRDCFVRAVSTLLVSTSGSARFPLRVASSQKFLATPDTGVVFSLLEVPVPQVIVLAPRPAYSLSQLQFAVALCRALDRGDLVLVEAPRGGTER